MFDNLNEFSAGDFAEANKQLYDNGVICPSGESTATTTALKVTNSSGNASIGDGSALIKGRVITVSGETVTLATNGTYKIVLEWSAASDGSQLKALSGSATLVQTDTQYQLLLATVAKSGASLRVTDNRGFINKLSGNTALSIQTVPVSPAPPTAGQMLICKDGQYVPSDIQEILWTGTCLGGNTISCNMSNYSRIRVEGNLGAYSFSFVMLLSFAATASQGTGFYGGNTLSVYNSAINRFDFMGIDVFVSLNKQNMKVIMVGYERASAFFDRNNNSTYLINKIIGIR